MPTFLGPPADSQENIGPLTHAGLLIATAEKHADREALVFHGPDGDIVRWNYAELLEEARRVGRALVAHGVVKGTRVAVLMSNRPEFVAAAFGVAMAGGVLVPVSTFITPPELDYIVRHSDASVILTQDRLLKNRYVDALVELCPELRDSAPGALRSPTFPFLRLVASLGVDEPTGAVLPYDAFLARANETSDEMLDACIEQVTPADDAIIIYTSGTTSRPKGVLHAHRSGAMQGWRLVRELCFGPGSRVWTAFPFFWTAGFSFAMSSTLAAGGCLVLQEGFDAGEALRLFEEERVTSALAKAHQFAQMEDDPDWLQRDLSSMRQVDMATSIARHPTVHIEGEWSTRSAFGLTETMTSLSSAPADTPEADRIGTYGWILPGNAIRIVDPDTGESLGVDEPGEITIKGVTLAKGYYKLPPEAVFDPDGYFHTSDTGFVDERNRLHFSGRASLMIKTGGANVSPIEIENQLILHPEIRMAWVIGVPDPVRDEVVAVCVVPHAGAHLEPTDIQEFLRGKLASYKIPRIVYFFEESELAMTGNGAKPKADVLRKLVEERRALQG